MKSALHTLQVLAKIGRILSKIVQIFCIIGACGCLAGMICMVIGVMTVGAFPTYALDFFMEEGVSLTVSSAYAAMLSGVIICTGEAILASCAAAYFRHELDAGTPFTFMGAKELKRLGILTIVIPVAASALSSLLCGMLSLIMENTGKIDFSSEISIGLGVMFLVMSVVFRYGAELAQSNYRADM